MRGSGQLLGVGAALKPTLSGYRNVLLGGLAMGLDRSEIEEQMDEIVEFSGLGSAMGRPMRTNSSGMRAPLAFSIATLRFPDVLLIDEALAVDDKELRRRSLARINEIRRAVGTFVMVTHHLDDVRQTSDRAVWLDVGHLVADGDVESVLDQHSGTSTTGVSSTRGVMCGDHSNRRASSLMVE